MHHDNFLVSAVIFLISAVIAVPLFKRFGLGSVLGYLTAGVVIGPWGLKLVTSEAADVMHVAELGVVMLLFLIGLELKPSRLWVMRRSVFGLGAIQVGVSAILLGGAFYLLGIGLSASIVAACALALSSTALVLQVLSERNELSSRLGRAGFSILLFQDLAVIPLLAAMSMVASASMGEAQNLDWSLVTPVAAVIGVIIVGRFAVDPLFKLIAISRSDEIFTAAALLIVLGVSALMNWAGLSMGLGAFLAGVLLAESEYRPQIQADIMPFRGLLLGLFFVAVGMSIDFGLLAQNAAFVAMVIPLVMGLKTVVIMGVARAFGNTPRDCLKLGLTLAQGGEFGFVLFSVAAGSDLIASETASLFVVVIAGSMALTPLILRIFDMLVKPEEAAVVTVDEEAELASLDEEQHPKVILLGFGRVGQIAGKLLLRENINFVALDYSPAQIELARKFGYKVYFGDASRTDVMLAAGAEEAEVLIVAVDNPQVSSRIIDTVRRRFPHLKILARARNREHARTLINNKVHYAMRETLECGLSLGKQTLVMLGKSPEDAHAIAEDFRHEDEKMLRESMEMFTEITPEQVTDPTTPLTPAQAEAANRRVSEKVSRKITVNFLSILRPGS